MLRFIIPIRHPEQVADVEEQQATLTQTFRCLERQRGDQWEVVVVTNTGTRLPPLSNRFSVRWVDFPPDPSFATVKTKRDFYEAVRMDKGRRILAGAEDLTADCYMMVADDDDLVEESVAEFVEQNVDINGWAITKGYRWDTKQKFVADLDDFHLTCGTSLIVKAGYYKFFGERKDGVSIEAIKELGSHRTIFERAKDEGQPFSEIPFRAAVYRTSHQVTTQTDVRKFKQNEKSGSLELLRGAFRRLRRLLKLSAPGGTLAGQTLRSEDFLREKFGL